MIRRLVVLLTFLLLLPAVRSVVSNDHVLGSNRPQLLEEPNPIIVDINGYGDHTTIEEAIDSSSHGDVIEIWEGRYPENILIHRDITLRGNGTSSTVIDGKGMGNVITILSGQVIIMDLVITNSGAYGSGVDMRGSLNCVIRGNRISNCGFGISGDLDRSGNNSILSNVIHDCSEAAIWIEGNNNNISGNKINDSRTGVAVNGFNNSIFNNTIKKNQIGISMGKLQNEVLIMGNSYTMSNSLDRLVEGSLTPSISNSKALLLSGGGMTLADHSTQAQTPGSHWNSTLNGGRKWNWAVLQDQSQIPGFPTTEQYWINSLNGAKVLNGMINGTGGQTILIAIGSVVVGIILNKKKKKPIVAPEQPEIITSDQWPYQR